MRSAQLPPPADLSPGLKWPNDVRLSGAKIAGILLENAGADAANPVIVAGLGVNVAAAPADMPYPVTSLLAAGVRSSRRRACSSSFPRALRRRLRRMAGGGLCRTPRALARAMADGLGEPVALRSW